MNQWPRHHRHCVLLNPDDYQTEVLSGHDDRGGRHFADLGEKPDVICIGALPPGGWLRRVFCASACGPRSPRQKIVVISWGLPDNAGPRREELLAVGADVAVITLLEARTQIAALVSSGADLHDVPVAVAIA